MSSLFQFYWGNNLTQFNKINVLLLLFRSTVLQHTYQKSCQNYHHLNQCEDDFQQRWLFNFMFNSTMPRSPQVLNGFVRCCHIPLVRSCVKLQSPLESRANLWKPAAGVVCLTVDVPATPARLPNRYRRRCNGGTCLEEISRHIEWTNYPTTVIPLIRHSEEFKDISKRYATWHLVLFGFQAKKGPIKLELGSWTISCFL